MDLGAGGARELGGEGPDRPGTEDQQAIARVQLGAPDSAQGVTAGLDHGAGDVVHDVGQGHQRGGRHRELLGQCSGPAAADPDLGAVLAQVLASGPAAVAAAAPEHRVAGDAASPP